LTYDYRELLSHRKIILRFFVIRPRSLNAVAAAYEGKASSSDEAAEFAAEKTRLSALVMLRRYKAPALVQ